MRNLTSYGPSLVVLLTTAIVLMAGPRVVYHLTHANTSARIIQASERLEQNNILAQFNQAYRDIATVVEPSVVHISARRVHDAAAGRSGESVSTGSGWIYDERGHVVTNHHVVENAARIDVQLYNGQIRPADLIASDPTTDIAVLRIPAGGLHPAVRADPSERVRQGDLVFAFGSPFDFRFSMSSGVVSGMGRSVGVIRDEFGRRVGYENFIQVDAAINPGNSGGPLTDYRGRVIGMNTAIATAPWRPHSPRSHEEGQFAGIGLAIPLDMIEPAVTQLIQTGEVRKGFLGVNILDASASIGFELTAQNYTGFGVMVGRMDEDHPAREQGLRVGDVITRINGERILTLQQLRAEWSGDRVDPDEDVDVRIWRFVYDRDSGTRETITLPGVLLREFRGMDLLDLSDPIATRLEQWGVSGRGVGITRVEPDGPAYEAGVMPGDFVTHVNDRPVASVDQLRSAISSMLPGDIAALRLHRYDTERDRVRTLTLNVELAELDQLRITGRISPDHPRDSIEQLGIRRMATATPELAAEMGVEYHPGVMLLEIAPENPLSRAARPGAIIVDVMDTAVRDADEFIKVLSELNLLVEPRITVIQPDGSTRRTRLRLN